MTRFRPCIDLHAGQVKQIVGQTLRDDAAPVTNFVADHDAAWFASRYRADNAAGGHVIQLGPGNEAAARAALAAWPGGLQLGGGVTADNAASWLDAGASQVIVTSWLFAGGHLQLERVKTLAATIGAERLVIDLSCRPVAEGPGQPACWVVATNRWQTLTETVLDQATIDMLSPYCSEFLIHAADVEGQQAGMDEQLIRHLADISPLPATYAGGARQLKDLELTRSLSAGKVDLTIGSALDIFGGPVAYHDCVAWNHHQLAC